MSGGDRSRRGLAGSMKLWYTLVGRGDKRTIVAELAGLSRAEMARQARAFGVQPRWSEWMVQEELVGAIKGKDEHRDVMN